jgi:GST-like protein
LLHVYTAATPNGLKIPLALEELGLDYTVHSLDLGKGDQRDASFLALNPNGKIPALHDTDGPGGPITVFESGAILLYLGERFPGLLPTKPAERMAAIAWTFFQCAGVGPMFGQLGHFRVFAGERVPYAEARYAAEAERLLSVLDGQLAQHPWIAGDTLTIADVAHFGWLDLAEGFLKLSLEPYTHVRAWLTRFRERPSVARAKARNGWHA